MRGAGFSEVSRLSEIESSGSNAIESGSDTSPVSFSGSNTNSTLSFMKGDLLLFMLMYYRSVMLL